MRVTITIDCEDFAGERRALHAFNQHGFNLKGGVASDEGRRFTVTAETRPGHNGHGSNRDGYTLTYQVTPASED